MNIPAPYRVDFFNELGLHCDLTVVFERTNATDRDTAWQSAGATNFAAIYPTGIVVGADKALCPSVLRYVLDRQFDVVVVGGYATPTGILAVLALRACGIPFILNTDGGFIREEARSTTIVKRFLVSRASAWLSTGRGCSRYLEHYGASPARIYEYPFTSVHERAVRTQPPRADERLAAREALGITESRCVVAVGQFIHRKGLDLLIRTAKSFDDAGVYIVGGEPSAEYLELREQTGATNVHFVGFQTREQLLRYYTSADLFVLPTREDAWGLVVNEAMSLGLPVITSDRCGAGLEMIEIGVNGQVVPSGDVSALMDAVRWGLSLSGSDAAGASLRRAREFTIEKMAQRHLEVFESLLGDR